MLPKRAMTLGASLRGMWMIWQTSRLNLNPSAERTVMVERFSSSLMGLGFAGCPVEHDVGGGHVVNLVRVRVDGVLAGIERIDPDAFLALAHQIAVPERVARDVRAFAAHIGDDHAHVGDGHLGHIHDLHGGEARIDEVTPAQEHLLLQALAALGVDERLRTLEHVVARRRPARRSRPRSSGLPFAGGDDADLVLGNVDRVGQLHREESGLIL